MRKDHPMPYPVATNITFTSLPRQRESLPPDLPMYSVPVENQQRHSHNVQIPHNNNAFAHLRNEISNLRSEFSRFIQKDVGIEQRPRKQERLAAHSTVGFYPQQAKNDSKAQFSFSFRPKQQEGQQERRQKQQNRFQKKYSFQAHLEPSKIQQLEMEIRKLGQIKSRTQQQNAILRKQIQRLETEGKSFKLQLQAQNKLIKQSLEQAEISFGLNSRLLEKVQRERDQALSQLKQAQLKMSQLESLLVELKLQYSDFQNKSKEQQSHLRAIYEDKIRTIENIRENSLKEIIDKWQNQQQLRKQAQLLSLLKQQQYNSLQKELQNHIEKIKVLEESIHSKADEQLSELRKKVESFKKTVEQLNAANNSGRQRLAVSKQETRRAKEDLRLVSQDLAVKQALISSLYRDINILDGQMRHLSHLKILLPASAKLADDLTQKIIQLQCKGLNSKYSLIQ